MPVRTKQEAQQAIDRAGLTDQFIDSITKGARYDTFGKDFLKLVFGEGFGGCLEHEYNISKFYYDRFLDIDWWAHNHSPMPSEFISTHTLDVMDKHNLGTIAKFIQNLSDNFEEVNKAISELYAGERIWLWPDHKESKPYQNLTNVIPHSLSIKTSSHMEVIWWICAFCRENNIKWIFDADKLIKDKVFDIIGAPGGLNPNIFGGLCMFRLVSLK